MFTEIFSFLLPVQSRFGGLYVHIVSLQCRWLKPIPQYKAIMYQPAIGITGKLPKRVIDYTDHTVQKTSQNWVNLFVFKIYLKYE